MLSNGTEVNAPSGQFSLRSLMFWITIVCVLCALLAVPPLFVLVVATFSVVFTGILGITIWKGRGWIQAFAVGAIVPQAGSLFVMFSANEPIEAVFLCGLVNCFAFATGVGSAAYHGFLVRREGILPVPNYPFVRTWFANDPDRASSTPQDVTNGE